MTGNCWPVWRLDPSSGHADKSCIPFGDWVGYGIDLVPTKRGLFFVAHGITKGDPTDPGAAGLYELRDGSAHRILSGFLSNPTVSPSGCKVAFAYAENGYVMQPLTPGSPRVLAIDLCSAKHT